MQSLSSLPPQACPGSLSKIVSKVVRTGRDQDDVRLPDGVPSPFWIKAWQGAARP